MTLFVSFRVFDNIYSDADVKHLREVVGAQLAHIQKSGKLKGGGIFGDLRGGFMLLDVEKGADLYELLGGAILDRFTVDSHPVLSFDELGEFFRKHPVG